jgi:hypothetical protein
MSNSARTNAPVECYLSDRRRAEPLAGLPGGAMVTRTASVRVISLLLLAVCGAQCQERPPADMPQLLQVHASGLPETGRDGASTWSTLPDTPAPNSARIPAKCFRSPLESEPGRVTSGLQPIQTPLTWQQVELIPKDESSFWDKYVYSPVPRQGLSYAPSSGGSFWSRASYATSRFLVTRDASGKGRMNTAYFLGVLTAAAVHNAYRPYRGRSNSATMNGFGSTIGSDMGLNVFHEFEPGIRQMVRSLTPKFVSRIGSHYTHAQTPSNPTPIQAR